MKLPTKSVNNFASRNTVRTGAARRATRAARLALAASFASLWMAAVPSAAQEKVMVGGAGSMVPVMQEIAQAYKVKNPDHPIEIMTNSLGSGGGIRATDAGRVAIGLSGRPLKGDEKASLVYRRLAVMPVVVAVNGEFPVTALTAAQICGIFDGTIKSWKQVGGPDVKIVALTRNEDDSDKEALRNNIGCYKNLKESPDVVMLTKGSEMTTALSTRPGTIGLTTNEATIRSQGRIKAVAIDGAAPGADTIRAGKYVLIKDFAVVTKGQPQGIAKAFIDYAASAEGEKIMTKSGLITSK